MRDERLQAHICIGCPGLLRPNPPLQRVNQVVLSRSERPSVVLTTNEDPDAPSKPVQAVPRSHGQRASQHREAISACEEPHRLPELSCLHRLGVGARSVIVPHSQSQVN